MFKIIFSAFRITVTMLILTGLIYPAVVWAVGQGLFKDKANGSLVIKDGKPIGSILVAQKFEKPEYFHPRPSAIDYAITPDEEYKKGNFVYNSGGSNLGPTNKKLIDRIGNDIKTLKSENPNEKIPLDLVTTSSSGLDPEISVAAALWQVNRIAKARNISSEKLKDLISANTEKPFLGFNGESRVNVLKINLELDQTNK